MKCDIINDVKIIFNSILQDILSQIFDAIQLGVALGVALQKQVHIRMSYIWPSQAFS